MAQMLKPMVSVIIPVYNGANYLSQAISSALSQSYENIEVIVVNDGSNDGGATETVARSFGPAIRYYEKANGGVASALNFAVKVMRGSYFSWLSHDDVYYPDKIALQVASLISLPPGACIVYSDYKIFSGNSIDCGIPVQMPVIESRHFRYFIAAASSLHGCSLLIPREAFDNVGMFDEGLRTTQDYDLWFRMASMYEFKYVPGVVLAARSHDQQDTRRISGVVRDETACLYRGFVRKLTLDDVPPNPTVAQGALSLALSLWQRGFREAAIEAEGLAMSAGATRQSVMFARNIAKPMMLLRFLARRVISPRVRQSLRMYIKNLRSGRFRRS